MIDYKTGLATFTDYLNNNINFIFTKLGDGELECIRSHGNPYQQMNCDGHLYTDKLSDNLFEFVKNISNITNLYLAKWEANDDITDFGNMLFEQLKVSPTLIDYNVVLPQEYNLDNSLLYNFYKSIKENKRRKIYICPERLNRVKKFLNVDIIVNIPLVNCFGIYDLILDQMLGYIQDGDIILYSASMMSKPLINELSKMNKNITQIDLGSAMDSLFVGQTRLGQPTTEECVKYFNDLI